MAHGSDAGEMGEHSGFAGNDGGHGDDGDHHGDGMHGLHGHAHGHDFSLAAGLGNGHGYANHLSLDTLGDMFAADNVCDRGAHDEHGPGHGDFAHATTAYAVAMEIMLAHDPGASLRWHPVGHLADIPAFQEFAVARAHEGANAGLKLPMPGKGRNTSTVEVLGFPHADVDVACFIERAARIVQTGKGLLKFLRLQGVTEIQPPCINAPRPIYRSSPDVLSLNPFGDKPKLGPQPNGFYPGVTGTTECWRRLWQVVPSCNWLWGQPKFMAWQTFLVEIGCVWRYADGLAESRVAFSTWSQGYTHQGDTVFDWDQIRMHRDCAEQFASQLWNFLQDNPADRAKVRARYELQASAATQPVPADNKLGSPRKPIDGASFPETNPHADPDAPVVPDADPPAGS